MTTTGIAGAAAPTAAPFFGAVQSKPKAQAATGSGSGSGSGSDSLSAGNLGTTFLSLLVQELQNQDPTQPMDPTAMVGQMISLNQLDQLISINQTLNPTASTTTGAAGGATPKIASAQQADAQSSAGGAVNGSAASLDPAQAGSLAAGNQSAAALAAQNAALNPAAPLNLGSLNTLFGGK